MSQKKFSFAIDKNEFLDFDSRKLHFNFDHKCYVSVAEEFLNVYNKGQLWLNSYVLKNGCNFGLNRFIGYKLWTNRVSSLTVKRNNLRCKRSLFWSCGSTLHLDDVIRVILTLFVNVELVSNKLLRIFRILSVLRKRTRPKLEMASQD